MLSTDERVALLRRVRFFAGAPASALPRVAAAMEPLTLAAGEALFARGDMGDSLYVIVEGRLMIHDGELLLNHLGPGDVVGELAALDAERRSASATAQAMQAGAYRPGQLAEVARRHDALGDLARVFQQMAAEVQELRIEIDRSRQERQVSAITGSSYFRQLQERAATLRASLDEAADIGTDGPGD